MTLFRSFSHEKLQNTNALYSQVNFGAILYFAQILPASAPDGSILRQRAAGPNQVLGSDWPSWVFSILAHFKHYTIMKRICFCENVLFWALITPTPPICVPFVLMIAQNRRFSTPSNTMTLRVNHLVSYTVRTSVASPFSWRHFLR